MIDFDQDSRLTQEAPVVSIKVVGVGGAGGNTINSMVESGYNFIESIAINTDAQALSVSKADVRLQLGLKSTKGMGTGANPELGKRAAEEDLSKIVDLLEGSDIVFLTGGMGGGTGSGALPVISRVLKELGILSVAVVTKPFEFEGKRRARVAQEAIELIKKDIDTLLIVPNQKLLDITNKNTSMIDAFCMINNVLCQSVKGISQIITSPGHINVDFADVKAIMKDTGIAVMGSGKASGENRAQEAALSAICSPLLENMSVEGATGVLINITGSKNLGLHEIGQAASIIHEQVSEDANIILGSVIDESMGDEVAVTIIATGIERLNSANIGLQEPSIHNVNNVHNVHRADVAHSQAARNCDYSRQSIGNRQSYERQDSFSEDSFMSRFGQENRIENVKVQATKIIDQENDMRFENNTENVYLEGLPEINASESEVFVKNLGAHSKQEGSVFDAAKKDEQKINNETIENKSNFVDLSDLDIPTFLRKS